MPNKDKKHIVLISLCRVINSKGGAEKVFCDMANAFTERGLDVTAICCESLRGGPAYPLNKEVHFINAHEYLPLKFLYKNPWKNIRCFSLNSKKRRQNRKYFEFSFFEKAINLVLNKIPSADILISYEPETTYILDRLNVKKPIITMFHSTPEFYGLDNWFEIYKSSVDRCAAVQVLLPNFVKGTRKFLPNVPIVVIPNVAPQNKVLANYKSKIIISVGHLMKNKRPLLLLEAFALLKERYPDWKCEWWGETCRDPTTLSKIQESITFHKLENQFLLCGTTNNIVDRLKQCSIFAFPTEREGFSLALAEAMSVGLPVVGAKDCLSVQSIIDDGRNGFLADSTPEKFASSLEKLMNDPCLRQQLGAQAKEDMKSFSDNSVWSLWIKLIDKIISTPATHKEIINI